MTVTVILQDTTEQIFNNVSSINITLPTYVDYSFVGLILKFNDEELLPVCIPYNNIYSIKVGE